MISFLPILFLSFFSHVTFSSFLFHFLSFPLCPFSFLSNGLNVYTCWINTACVNTFQIKTIIKDIVHFFFFFFFFFFFNSLLQTLLDEFVRFPSCLHQEACSCIFTNCLFDFQHHTKGRGSSLSYFTFIIMLPLTMASQVPGQIY